MDPISDFLTRIKNAQLAGRESLVMPYSNAKFGLAKILAEQGFIAGAQKTGQKTKQNLEITLKYTNGQAAISDLRRVSKSGQRLYTGSQKIKRVKQGFGIAIISTSQGLMTDREAKKKKIGGEIICEVW